MPRQRYSQSPDAVSLFSLRSRTPSTYVCPDSEEEPDNVIYARIDDAGDAQESLAEVACHDDLGASLPPADVEMASRQESTAAAQARQTTSPQGGTLFSRDNCFSPPPEPEESRLSPSPPVDGESEGEEEEVSSYNAADIQEEGPQQDDWESRKYKVTQRRDSHLTGKSPSTYVFIYTAAENCNTLTL